MATALKDIFSFSIMKRKKMGTFPKQSTVMVITSGLLNA